MQEGDTARWRGGHLLEALIGRCGAFDVFHARLPLRAHVARADVVANVVFGGGLCTRGKHTGSAYAPSERPRSAGSGTPNESHNGCSCAR